MKKNAILVRGKSQQQNNMTQKRKWLQGRRAGKLARKGATRGGEKTWAGGSREEPRMN